MNIILKNKQLSDINIHVKHLPQQPQFTYIVFRVCNYILSYVTLDQSSSTGNNESKLSNKLYEICDAQISSENYH